MARRRGSRHAAAMDRREDRAHPRRPPAGGRAPPPSRSGSDGRCATIRATAGHRRRHGVGALLRRVLPRLRRGLLSEGERGRPRPARMPAVWVVDRSTARASSSMASRNGRCRSPGGGRTRGRGGIYNPLADELVLGAAGAGNGDGVPVQASTRAALEGATVVVQSLDAPQALRGALAGVPSRCAPSGRSRTRWRWSPPAGRRHWSRPRKAEWGHAAGVALLDAGGASCR